MKKLLLTLAAVAVLGGCKSTASTALPVTPKTIVNINYPTQPNNVDVMYTLTAVMLYDTYKCNDSSEGYICYSTDKGNFAFDGEKLIGIDNFTSELVNPDKSYQSLRPSYSKDKKEIFALKDSSNIEDQHIQQLIAIDACSNKTEVQRNLLAKKLTDNLATWSGRLISLNEEQGTYNAIISPTYGGNDLRSKFRLTAIVRFGITPGDLEEYNIGDTVDFFGDILQIEQQNIIYDFGCHVIFDDAVLLPKKGS
ncbi:hypothetical protein [Pseudoalteromonas nigrifaciens]|uniref:hypothetical protein n=1 Tax=Pseudoalteromonas nigrifaciens TaxID=28109 RepID=UPI003F965C00